MNVAVSLSLNDFVLFCFCSVEFHQAKDFTFVYSQDSENEFEDRFFLQFNYFNDRSRLLVHFHDLKTIYGNGIYRHKLQFEVCIYYDLYMSDISSPTNLYN